MSSKSIQIIGGPDRNSAYVDLQTNSMATHDHIVHLIHSGRLFSSVAENFSVGVGARLVMLVKTGAKPIHVRFSSFTDKLISVRLFEDTVVSADGTPRSVINRNRTSTNTAAAQIFQDPTITSDGTAIVSGTLPGGSKKDSIGGIFDGITEWVLKPNTNYSAQMINNLSGAAAITELTAIFMEEI